MPDGGGKPRRGRGRPTLYTEEIAEEICDRLANGESLNVICRDAHLPDEALVRQWAKNVDELPRLKAFSTRYTRARESGYEVIAESILSFGTQDCTGPDGYVDNGEIQRLRLLSENRKWLLSKMLPKQFGDKVTQEITGEDGGALITRIELVPVAPRVRAIEDSQRQIEHEPAAKPKPKPRRGV